MIPGTQSVEQSGIKEKGGDFINHLSLSNNLAFNRLSFYSSPQSFAGSVNSTGFTNPVGSPEALEKQKAQQSGNKGKVNGQPDVDTYECQTCKNRKYQDGSDDPGVSFKAPTKISPERAAYAIRSHEMEHVAHAWAKAQKEDREIVSQSVSYHTDICPECGKVYMSGGTTRTVFRSKQPAQTPVQKGKYLDVTV